MVLSPESIFSQTVRSPGSWVNSGTGYWVLGTGELQTTITTKHYDKQRDKFGVNLGTGYQVLGTGYWVLGTGEIQTTTKSKANYEKQSMSQ